MEDTGGQPQPAGSGMGRSEVLKIKRREMDQRRGEERRAGCGGGWTTATAEHRQES